MRKPFVRCLVVVLPLIVSGLCAEDSFEGKLKVEAIPPPAAPATAPRASFFYDMEADESKWGDLTLRFVYDGEWPKPKQIVPNRGGAFESEDLVVHAKDFGIANIGMWLYRTLEGPPLPVHPSYAKTAGANVEMKTQGQVFVPHVLCSRTGQKLVVRNADAHGYNVKAELFNNQSLNNLIQAGESFEFTFAKQERTPFRLDDSIHPWMLAYVIVRDDPYAAISDKSGNLKIDRLPIGKWTFVVWHEQAGYIKEATIRGEKVKWERGRVTLDLKAGENDLGTVKLAPAVFKR
jgi:hypothetical protein